MFCSRFVIPKTSDLITQFDGELFVAAKHAVGSCWDVARVVVSDVPGPWIAQRAVTVKATPSSFVGHLKTVLRAFFCVDDGEPTEVRLLVANDEFLSMTDNGRQVLDDLERAANVAVGNYEVYPLVGETAIHVVGRLSAIVKFASLLNESLCNESAVFAESRLAADRQLTERIGTVTSGSAATWPFRPPVRRVRCGASFPKLVKQFARPSTDRPIVAARCTLGKVTEEFGKSAIRHVTARCRNQAMVKATLAYAPAKRPVVNIVCDGGPLG